MGADVNIKTIQGVYDAFSRGDVAAIQDVVTDDVDWASEAASSVAPWYGVKRGKAGVGEFFAASYTPRGSLLRRTAIVSACTTSAATSALLPP